MKLFASILAATLMQGTEATCTTPVFSVTCHDDLMIELAVDKTCWDSKYGSATLLTSLQIKPSATSNTATAPTGQCLPCTEVSPQVIVSTDPGYCDPAATFFGYDYYDTSATAAAVDGTTTWTTASLFFHASHCGTTLTISGNDATFTTSIGIPATVATTDDVATGSTLSETTISCTYPKTLSAFQLMDSVSVVADNTADTDKVAADNTPQLAADVKNAFTMGAYQGTDNTGTLLSASSEVTLGQEVYIEASTDSTALDYYFDSCTATDGSSKSLKLVKGGCLGNLGALQTNINPSTGTDGKSLSFKQFAFADTTASTLSLSFAITCDIVLGTKPTSAQCQALVDGGDSEIIGTAGRKRRSISKRETDSGYQQSAEYQVTAGNKIAEVHGDIVVAHDGEAKTTEGTNSGAAVTTAAAFMAGTAIMLL